MKNLYLLLTVIGVISPYYFFAGFLLEFGLDVHLFIGREGKLVSANNCG